MPSHSHSPVVVPREPRLRAVEDVPEPIAVSTPLAGDPLIGRRLGGRYTVERLIGRGGMGLVYLARQLDTPNDVVVKVLAPHWVRNDDAATRFDREATRLGALRHPNIVTLLDHGHEDGTAYLVMEHLEGELLREFLSRRGPLPLAEFVPIAAQVLKGIGHAHTRELMVRDVKPSNIMLCERKGRANFVKLLDLSLTPSTLPDAHDPGSDEHVFGTVGYLAPEVIRGEAIDLRVDVYAIGVLFHHMLAGRLPFEGRDSATIFYKTLGEPAPRLPTALGLPEGLVELVHRCLAKHPDDRPADANAIVEELIDAVPAHLFRLPRARGSRSSAGNTGMLEIIGQSALSGPHEREDSGAVLLDTMPIDPTETHPSVQLAVGPPPSQRPAMRVLTIAVIAGALMAVLGGLIAAIVLADGDGDHDGEVAVAGAIASASAGDDAVNAGLVEAAHLIDEGRLDRASEVLDGVRGLVGDAPALQARLERTDRALLVARLMNTAARFEGQGEIAAAVSAYRDVLGADPTHAVARSRLGRLDVASDAESAASGAISIASEPEAELTIDGQSVGSTPFTGRLPVGRHVVRMSARGHQAWEGAIEVTEEHNEAMKVRLHGKASSRSKPSASKPVVAAPPPAQESKPVSEVVAPKRDVFLPGASKSSDGIFLPTKD
jgi:serine/threonine protein kinase